ncbi:helix-turn-helix domain-containing protein [Streptomyces albipurpureus]|uniref:Helix-turn-helix domain-containing protein n=1 Tax=Streptomyces albipurpureus TaxID=2897419 RepID=A0ABT0UMN5_9ACTN|nr:helix-turn-helix transcriptional regulator [Streptomyces sp. CWNU-1]MCM2389715.1 helix-turn-helix domain-containing protein [Streptomyces sp. CWNU-1]
MGEIAAAEIRAVREALGWDQAELARRVGVRHQTISRWERGDTSPKGKRLDRVRAALGLDGAAPPPRRPLLDELPFNRLNDEQFEAFSEALASLLYPDAVVLRYGIKGNKQHGIDIRVVTAEGERIGIQCKKYEKFGLPSFTNAVAELDRANARVDRCVLYLSTRASTPVADACDNLGDWLLWDSRVLSREVGNLPTEQALTLVDRFFPGMREEFLGVRTPSVWQTVEEAYSVSVPSPIHSHEFELVGRATTLDAMRAFAAGDKGARIAVLTGAAGEGKSRLLCELARERDLSSKAITRVLLPGPFSPEEFERLPAENGLLVIIEDAHERSDDLAMVVSGVLRAHSGARVLLSARPYGRHLVQQTLRAAKTDENVIPWWNLAALRPEEAYALAGEVLGEGKEYAARVVAHVAADSPLLLVNVAAAIRRGSVSVNDIQDHTDVHRQLLELLVESALSQPGRSTDDRALLHAVAALQPVVTSVDHFQEALSGLLGVEFNLIRPRLDALQHSGIVVRRGASMRISPDLLGDALLAEASIDPHDGSSTGYLRDVRNHASGDALANALINAGRVDWQRSGPGSRRGDVLDPLWSVLESEFKQAGAWTRTTLMRLLVKIAPFQPQRALHLTRWALANPTEQDDRPSEINWVPGQFSHADVLGEVPRVLAAVAVDLDQVRGVYDLLWSLGRDDERPLDRHPNAPLRILIDLASYTPGKPLAYQEILLDALSEWLEETPPKVANRMPLALLDPLFADVAEGQTMEAWTLTLSRHPVRADVVAPVRERATRILLDQYASEDDARAALAAATFQEILRYENEEPPSHTVGFLRELATQVTVTRPGPLVALATRRSLSWTVSYGAPPVREAAQKVVHSLPNTLEHRLALLLHTGIYDTDLAPRSGNADSLEEAPKHWEALHHQTADELKLNSADETARLLVSLVTDGHRLLTRHSEGVHAMLDVILRKAPDTIPPLLDLLGSSAEGTVGVMLPTALRAAFEADLADSMDICRRLAADGNPAEVLAVTQALQATIMKPEVQEGGALELAQALANHPDPAVRAGVLGVAVPMLRTSKDMALELIASVPFGETGAVPHRLWWAFTLEGLLSWRDLTNAHRAFFLHQLTTLPTLNDYSVQQFVSHIAEADAPAAVGLLRARVEHGEEEPGFDSLPFKWTVRLPFADSPDRLKLLRSVRDWLAEPREKPWRREMQAPELFWTVAGNADEPVLRLLLEPYLRGESDLAHAVAPLLEKVPKDIVWERVDFVTILLKSASRLSEELMRRSGGRLHSAISTGFRWGSPGQPYPEDVDISKRAQLVRKGLPRGSVVDQFYQALQDTAERNMERAIAEG